MIVIAALAYFAYKVIAPSSYVNQATIPPTQNNTVSLTNSSALNTNSGTNNTANVSISDSTLSGNVTRDQNYSLLSTGNIISSP